LRVNCIVRLLCVLLILSGCVSREPFPTPSDTKFREDQRNWEYLYAKELDAAIENEDVISYYFFWPLYMQARYENKCKLYNPLHHIECNCP